MLWSVKPKVIEFWYILALEDSEIESAVVVTAGGMVVRRCLFVLVMAMPLLSHLTVSEV